jgi:hypothetical protein
MQPDYQSPKLRTTSWKDGQSGNPDGRPPGARNKSSYELRERLKARGDIDPAEFLSSLVSNEDEPKELRVAASNVLMPYYHSKLGAIPAPPPKIYLETQIHYPCPEPKSIEQVNTNIWYVDQLIRTGQIDRDWGDSLINTQRVIGNNIIDEAKLLAANADPNIQPVIRIEGGLPPLPGSDVIMPQLNGHRSLELEANKDPINGPQSHPAEPDKP